MDRAFATTAGSKPEVRFPIFYDSLLSKVIVWGEDRVQATARMRRALAEYEIRGVRSTLPFSRWLLARPEFVEARFHTGFLDELLQQRAGEPFGEPDPSLEEVAAMAACLVEASVPACRGVAARTVEHGRQPGSRDAIDRTRRSMERSWKARARKESLRG